LPESSDGISNHRWNYSPLKEKAVWLPDGLFVILGRFAANRQREFFLVASSRTCCYAARRPSGLAANGAGEKCRFAPHRIEDEDEEEAVQVCSGKNDAKAGEGGAGLQVSSTMTSFTGLLHPLRRRRNQGPCHRKTL